VSDEQGSEQGVPKPRGRKSVPWRQDPVILARLPLVDRRYLKGEPNTAIAAALGVDEGTIRNDIKRLRELWLERAGGQIEDLRAQKVAELQDIYRRSLDAAEWDAFCERAVLFDDPTMPIWEMQKYGLIGPDYPTDGSGQPLKIARDEKGSATFRGNKAAALAQARQAVMDQAKVLGLVVEKREITGKDGEPLIKAYVGVDLEEV
jgi:transposase